MLYLWQFISGIMSFDLITLDKIKRPFYERDTLAVARDLLGKYLVHDSKDGITAGIIVECEAYIGPDDPASHTFKGKRTRRTEVQFGPAGHAYVYLIYGMYCCFNVVTKDINMPEVVFIRALEPVVGMGLMAERRGATHPGKGSENLTNGPSKLCIAMGIDKSLYGVDLCGDRLFLASGDKNGPLDIASSPRINIGYAGEGVYYHWRFYIKNNRFVSRA